jgi:hypothetical protein
VRPRPIGVKGLGLAFAAAAALSAWLALRDLDAPGLYYDEVIQAVPAAEFLREGGRPLQIPGAKSVRLAGGWFPVLTQPYMGALKSQLLIPVFAAFGPSAAALRATTFAWGLAGCLFAALFAARLLGPAVGVATGALLALDPAFLFVSRHDWGSFALGLLLRCAGLWLAAVGLERLASQRGRRAAWLAASGLALGLGVYNKIDQLPAIAAAAAALALCFPRAAVGAVRGRAGAIAAFAAGLAAGAAPLAAAGLRGAAAVGSVAGDLRLGPDLAEKLFTWRTFFDGSYFHRLMLAGGSFEALPGVTGAATGLFLPALAASAALLAVQLARRRPWQARERALAFALAALGLGMAALLLLPRAVRIHHVLNVTPFPQLVVAAAAVELWRAGARPGAGLVARAAPRALAAAGLAAALAGHLCVDLRTLAEIRGGGRGRWSDALAGYARELAAEPGTPVVSLDWGFHAPLRFLAPQLDLREPIWTLRGGAGAGTRLDGAAGTVYLVQDARYRVFDLGQAFLAAVAHLPAGAAAVRAHPDRSGATAFVSVRVARPHRLVYRGRLEVELE